MGDALWIIIDLNKIICLLQNKSIKMSIQKRTIKLPQKIQLSPYLVSQPSPPIPYNIQYQSGSQNAQNQQYQSNHQQVYTNNPQVGMQMHVPAPMPVQMHTYSQQPGVQGSGQSYGGIAGPSVGGKGYGYPYSGHNNAYNIQYTNQYSQVQYHPYNAPQPDPKPPTFPTPTKLTVQKPILQNQITFTIKNGAQPSRPKSPRIQFKYNVSGRQFKNFDTLQLTKSTGSANNNIINDRNSNSINIKDNSITNNYPNNSFNINPFTKERSIQPSQLQQIKQLSQANQSNRNSFNFNSRLRNSNHIPNNNSKSPQQTAQIAPVPMPQNFILNSNSLQKSQQILIPNPDTNTSNPSSANPQIQQNHSQQPKNTMLNRNAYINSSRQVDPHINGNGENNNRAGIGYDDGNYRSQEGGGKYTSLPNQDSQYVVSHSAGRQGEPMSNGSRGTINNYIYLSQNKRNIISPDSQFPPSPPAAPTLPAQSQPPNSSQSPNSTKITNQKYLPSKQANPNPLEEQDRSSRIKIHNEYINQMLQEYEKLRRYSQYGEASGNGSGARVGSVLQLTNYNYSYSNGNQFPRVEKNSSDEGEDADSRLSRRSEKKNKDKERERGSGIKQANEHEGKGNQVGRIYFHQVPSANPNTSSSPKHTQITPLQPNTINRDPKKQQPVQNMDDYLDINGKNSPIEKNGLNANVKVKTRRSNKSQEERSKSGLIKEESEYMIQGIQNIRSQVYEGVDHIGQWSSKDKEQYIERFIQRCIQKQLQKYHQNQKYLSMKTMVNNMNSKINTIYSKQKQIRNKAHYEQIKQQESDDNSQNENGNGNTNNISQLILQLREKDLEIKNLKNQVWLLRMKEKELTDLVEKLTTTNQQQYAYIQRIANQIK